MYRFVVSHTNLNCPITPSPFAQRNPSRSTLYGGFPRPYPKAGMMVAVKTGDGKVHHCTTGRSRQNKHDIIRIALDKGMQADMYNVQGARRKRR